MFWLLVAAGFVGLVMIGAWLAPSESTQRSMADLPLVTRELERDRIRVSGQISSFLAKVERDSISAMNLRFVKGKGMVADPFEFKGRFLTGTVALPEGLGDGDSGTWTPREYQEAGITIAPVCGVMTAWGIAIAFRVAHRNPYLRLKLNWFKKSDPPSGPVYAVDPINHQYLHLTASSMTGEVLPGIPRTGIVMFPVPDSPTDRFEVHFSGVSVGADPRNKASFSFEFTDSDLSEAIESFHNSPTQAQKLEASLESEVDRVRRMWLAQR